MRRRPPVPARAPLSVLAAAITLALALGGCATLSRKFGGTQVVNLEPFADQTLALLGSLDYRLAPDDAFMLHEYMDFNDPSYLRLIELQESERIFLLSLMNYSLEIVQLQESGQPETAQVRRYADDLHQAVFTFLDTVKVSTGMSRADYEQTIGQVRGQRTLLAALRAAKPLVHEFAQMQIRLMLELGERREEVVAHVNGRIDSVFAPALLYTALLDRETRALMSDAHLGETIERGTSAQRQALQDKLSELKELRELLAPEVERRADLRLRLARIGADYDTKTRRLGGAVLLWAQAHRKMSDGVTKPAEWFNPTGLMWGAAKSVAPVPLP